MGLPPGTFQLGPDVGRLTVCTTKAGIGARVAHDLVLEAARWSAAVTVGDDLADSEVRAEVDPTSLAVVDASGGVRDLSDEDRAEIREILLGPDGLRTAEHPAITFQASSVQGDLPHLTVSGDLTIAGVSQPVCVSVTVEGTAPAKRGDATPFTAQATVVQSDHGISPYSTLFGAIKVADAVEIVVDAALGGR